MRTRPRFSSDPVSPLDEAQGKSHRPVLLGEAIEYLAIQADDCVVDATLGGAGHAKAIAEKLGSNGVLIGFDLDRTAIERGREALVGVKPQVHLIEANFRDLEMRLKELGVKKVSKILFDLGWSSYQLDSGRGFSLHADEPLLMTYSASGGAVTAAVIVNKWEESSLADIIYGFGEERYSRRIAKAIVKRREVQPFVTAQELAETIKDCVPARYRFGRIHPATRTFQALRIAVNDELGALKDGLEGAWRVLEKDGRIAVITFHSIEDRIVKRMFKGFEETGEGERIMRKPIVPSAAEVRENPRARSAKLRVIQKSK
jgi:16S rRNA (cytosine1402-N4)-methyltransferase